MSETWLIVEDRRRLTATEEFLVRIAGWKYADKPSNRFVDWSNHLGRDRTEEYVAQQRARIGADVVDWAPHITRVDLFVRYVTPWVHSETGEDRGELSERLYQQSLIEGPTIP